MNFARRRYLEKLIGHRHNHLIKVITGMRRSGKSYLLFTIFYNHLLKEGVDESHIIRVDLEDRRNKALRNPDALLEYIDGRMKDKEMYYILLDEIQFVPEFEDVLNSYLNISNADVYVTRNGLATAMGTVFALRRLAVDGVGRHGKRESRVS